MKDLKNWKEFSIGHFRGLYKEYYYHWGDASYWEEWIDRLAQNNEWNSKYLTMGWREKRDEAIGWVEAKLKEI